MNINDFKSESVIPAIPKLPVSTALVFTSKIREAAESAKLFTATHLSILRTQYESLETVNPTGPAFLRLRAEVAKWTPEMLNQVAMLTPPIKWLTYLAKKQIADNDAK